jgi:hypothetical protein
MTDETHTQEQTSRLALPTSYAWFNAWYGSPVDGERTHTIGIPAEFPDATVAFTVRCGSTHELISHDYSSFRPLNRDEFETTAPLAKAIRELCTREALKSTKKELTLDIRIAPTTTNDGYVVWFQEVRK